MKKRTFVYVDGLNLDSFLKSNHPKLRWLDVVRLAKNMLGGSHDIVKVNYYSSPLIGDSEEDIKKARHQSAYWEALESRDELEIHEGDFAEPEKYGTLLTANRYYRNPLPPLPDSLPSVLKFRTREEKKTDVTLASHLVRDAFYNPRDDSHKPFEVAAVVTNDRDFCEAIRVVKEDAQLPIWLFSPVKRDSGIFGPHGDLLEIVTPNFQKRIAGADLANAQFLRQIPNTNITRPPKWG